MAGTGGARKPRTQYTRRSRRGPPRTGSLSWSNQSASEGTPPRDPRAKENKPGWQQYRRERVCDPHRDQLLPHGIAERTLEVRFVVCTDGEEHGQHDCKRHDCNCTPPWHSNDANEGQREQAPRTPDVSDGWHLVCDLCEDEPHAQMFRPLIYCFSRSRGTRRHLPLRSCPAVTQRRIVTSEADRSKATQRRLHLDLAMGRLAVRRRRSSTRRTFRPGESPVATCRCVLAM